MRYGYLKVRAILKLLPRHLGNQTLAVSFRLRNIAGKIHILAAMFTAGAFERVFDTGLDSILVWLLDVTQFRDPYVEDVFKGSTGLVLRVWDDISFTRLCFQIPKTLHH